MLCYVSPEDKNKIKILEGVQMSMPRVGVEYFTTTDSFRERLLVKLGQKTIAIVSAATEKDLMDLYFIQHLLRKVKMILLLPDVERHTIAMGHRLYPSFMCSADAELSELLSVLNSFVADGTLPKPREQFQNPYEASMPCRLTEYYGHWIQAA